MKTMKSNSPIIPAALVISKNEMKKHLDFARETSNSIHIDVMDGKFSNGDTLAVKDWPEIDLGYSEAHLMVENPLHYFEDIKEKGVTRAIIHVESTFDEDEIVTKAKQLDLLLGFAVNPDTDLEKLRKYYKISNYFQVMGVHPGKIGQEMEETTSMAISYIRRISSNRRLIISVDGGVTKQNIPELKKNGANYFISSAAIYNNEKSWHDNYNELLEVAK